MMLTRLTPINYSALLHIAVGLRPQTFLDPVWKQTDLVTESKHAEIHLLNLCGQNVTGICLREARGMLET